jgi:sulfate adenylyltransferase subunit 1
MTSPLLRFTTAGSVDDGKSTLIGRLLHDSGALLDDQIADLHGAGGDLDFARITDGLEAEREQGITIDVAYRYFSSARRRYIIADAPGHEQYTRNMVTAASQADAVIILVDASRVGDKGLKSQTKRHAAIAALMGLPAIITVNKLDLVGWSQAKFEEVKSLVERLARTLDLQVAAIVPIAAKAGDNIVHAASHGWYAGPTLLDVLDQLEPTASAAGLRAHVQRLVRWPDGGRGYQILVASGTLRQGDQVALFPSGITAVVDAIDTFSGARHEAQLGDAVTIRLDRDVDLGRGGWLTAPGAPASQDVAADLCWLDSDAWTPGRVYTLAQGASRVPVLIQDVLHRHDGLDEPALVGTAQGLALNALARVRITAQQPLLADGYAAGPALGGVLLIDPVTQATVAAGMLRAAA